MPYPFYPHLDGPATHPVALPPPWNARADQAAREQELRCYLPDQGLQDAVNAALLLGQPLLLTGEAGTGKTRLADHLAWQLGLGEPLRFETKTASVARDLFYLYDALRHFQSVRIDDPQKTASPADALDYFTLNPLGLAILRSQPLEELADRGLLPLLERAGARHTEPRRSLVLIDEIDKAPRDFPNDILNEIETLFFRIPELATRIGSEPIRANPSLRPVVVITSNSEKHLPEPFLRRCVYYNIPFPGREQMRAILAEYARDLEQRAGGFFNDVLDLFYACHRANLKKPPSTAELLAWLHLLREVFRPELVHGECRLREPRHAERLRKTLATLVKVREDQERIGEVLEGWLKRPA